MLIREDDLSGDQVRDLLRFHLAGLAEQSPPQFNFALDLTGLSTEGITVWSAWDGGSLLGIGALKQHDASLGEIKSMRTHPAHLRKGAAAALLEHIIAVAKDRGLQRLALETGTGPAFEPALALYRKRGFRSGPPFADYAATKFNQFLHLALDR